MLEESLLRELLPGGPDLTEAVGWVASEAQRGALRAALVDAWWSVARWVALISALLFGVWATKRIRITHLGFRSRPTLRLARGALSALAVLFGVYALSKLEAIVSLQLYAARLIAESL